LLSVEVEFLWEDDGLLDCIFPENIEQGKESTIAFQVFQLGSEA
jgi:hypothetical protein